MPLKTQTLNVMSPHDLSLKRYELKLIFEMKTCAVVINQRTFMSVIVDRSHAIACVNQFIIARTQALMVHIDSFIEVSSVNASVGCQ